MKKLAARYANDSSHEVYTDADTELDTTASTGNHIQQGSVSDVYFNESSADVATVKDYWSLRSAAYPL